MGVLAGRRSSSVRSPYARADFSASRLLSGEGPHTTVQKRSRAAVLRKEGRAVTAEASHSPQERKLYVGGLSLETTQDGLRAFFDQVGFVEDVFVVTETLSGSSNGYGFVQMATVAGARGAVEELNGELLDGCPIMVDLERPPDPRAFRPAR